MQRVLYGSVPQTFQKPRPQTEVTGKKRNRAGSWWKLQMRADLQTRDKLKESSCPQVAPVKGEKSYRNEMLPSAQQSSQSKHNLMQQYKELWPR